MVVSEHWPLRLGRLSVVSVVPETRFAKTREGAHVAYQVVGDGPHNVLIARVIGFPVDMMWEEPRLVRFLDRLSTFCRHIWFDPRGTGASDRIAPEDGRLWESVVDDMVAVLDDAGWDRAALVGLGASMPLLFAATHSQRSTALVLVDAPVALRSSGDNPSGFNAEEAEAFTAQDPRLLVAQFAPSLVDDERFTAWFGRASRLVATPADRVWRARAAMQVDLRPALAATQVPTLVVAGTKRRMFRACRLAAERIAGAKLVETPRDDWLPFVGDTGPMLDAIEEFLTGQLPAHHADRVLATVLFTDVVGSTEHAARLGDRRWREVLATHDDLLRAEVERFRGRMVKSTGDGVLATFDGPGRAIRCARAIRDSVRSLGIDVRAGLHTGEIELVGADVAGMAVHIGARVSVLAGAGEVLVSSTVKDLVAGSGIEFEDRGEHVLKGVPGTWHLYSVVA